MHRKLTISLDPSLGPSASALAAADDWIKDVEGREYINQEARCRRSNSRPSSLPGRCSRPSFFNL